MRLPRPGHPAHMSFPRFAAGFAVAVGCLVLLGWSLDLDVLRSVVPGLVPMNPATAASLVLSGLSLALLANPDPRRAPRLVGRALAVVVALVGSLKLCDHFLGGGVGIDQWLFGERLLAVEYAPNRMAPNTALNFVFCGLALLLLDVEVRRRYRPAQFLALAAAAVSLLALSGHAYTTLSLLDARSTIPMAVPSALAFGALSAGVLLARPGRGVMAVVSGSGAGGTTARRLLLAAAGIPLGLGWLRLLGEQAGLYDREFGVALFAVSSTVVLAAVVWWNAGSLQRAEAQRLRATEERDRFFTLALDLLCVAGPDGRFKSLNPAWEQTLGFTAGELMAAPYMDFVHPDDREATVREAAGLAAGTKTLSFENRYRCKDGSYRWLLWKAVPSPDGQSVYAAARDITDRRNAEQELRLQARLLDLKNAQLEAANKELEAFCYSVSHDLRAPLRSIDGFSQALLEDYAERLDDDGRDSLRRVRAATQRMGQLIDDLLNLSRVARAEPSRERVDLSEAARAVIEDLRKADPGREVEVVVSPGLVAEADARLMRVVLENLLRNAWKFTGKTPGARIEFGCSAAGGVRAYYVRDNGAGFDMAYAAKLFGVFQRLHAMGEYPGTGVGLATVQRIIHRHGGRVWAEGAVGKGATFAFTV